MGEQLLAWHGDPTLKAEVMERLRAHRAADAIVQGAYQISDPAKALGYRGCALGCTLPKQHVSRWGEPVPPPEGWAGEIERQYGIDHRIAECIDDTFENLLRHEAGDFAVAVVDAIPVGADLDAVAAWLDENYDGEDYSARARSPMSSSPASPPLPCRR